jgi:hypothetical protein
MAGEGTFASVFSVRTAEEPVVSVVGQDAKD